jgi:hypothetical protein
MIGLFPVLKVNFNCFYANWSEIQLLGRASFVLSVIPTLRVDRQVDLPLPPSLLPVYHKPKWVVSVVTVGQPESLHPDVLLFLLVRTLDTAHCCIPSTALKSKTKPWWWVRSTPRHCTSPIETKVCIYSDLDGRSSLGHGPNQMAPYLVTLRAGLSALCNQTEFGAAGLFECITARTDNGIVD